MINNSSLSSVLFRGGSQDFQVHRAIKGQSQVCTPGLSDPQLYSSLLGCALCQRTLVSQFFALWAHHEHQTCLSLTPSISFIPILAEPAPQPLLLPIQQPDLNFCLPQASAVHCSDRPGWGGDAHLASLPR